MLACKLSTGLELLSSGGSNAKLRSFDTLLISLNELLCMGVTAITKGVTTITKVVTAIRKGVTAIREGVTTSRTLTNFVFGIYLISIHYSKSNSATCQDTHLLSEFYAGKHLEPNAGWHYDFGLLTVEKRKATTMSTLEFGQKFSSITAAKQTVKEYIIHQG